MFSAPVSGVLKEIIENNTTQWVRDEKNKICTRIYDAENRNGSGTRLENFQLNIPKTTERHKVPRHNNSGRSRG